MTISHNFRFDFTEFGEPEAYSIANDFATSKCEYQRIGWIQFIVDNSSQETKALAAIVQHTATTGKPQPPPIHNVFAIFINFRNFNFYRWSERPAHHRENQQPVRYKIYESCRDSQTTATAIIRQRIIRKGMSKTVS